MITLYKGCTLHEAAKLLTGKKVEDISLTYDMALAEQDGPIVIVFELEADPIYDIDGQYLVFDTPKAVRSLNRNVNHIFKL